MPWTDSWDSWAAVGDWRKRERRGGAEAGKRGRNQGVKEEKGKGKGSVCKIPLSSLLFTSRKKNSLQVKIPTKACRVL